MSVAQAIRIGMVVGLVWLSAGSLGLIAASEMQDHSRTEAPLPECSGKSIRTDILATDTIAELKLGSPDQPVLMGSDSWFDAIEQSFYPVLTRVAFDDRS